MHGEAIRLKADGLSNGDIICALGIHESMFYRWIGDPMNKLQRALNEGIKRGVGVQADVRLTPPWRTADYSDEGRVAVIVTSGAVERRRRAAGAICPRFLSKEVLNESYESTSS